MNNQYTVRRRGLNLISFDNILIVSSAVINRRRTELDRAKRPTVPAVPEPGTWVPMLLGFGGIGMATLPPSHQQCADADR